MSAAGFANVAWRRLTCGIVCLHVGEKPEKSCRRMIGGKAPRGFASAPVITCPARGAWSGLSAARELARELRVMGGVPRIPNSFSLTKNAISAARTSACAARYSQGGIRFLEQLGDYFAHQRGAQQTLSSAMASARARKQFKIFRMPLVDAKELL